jgi:hypothetical protein
MTEAAAAILRAADQVERARERTRLALDATTEAAYELVLELEMCGLSVRISQLRDEEAAR